MVSFPVAGWRYTETKVSTDEKKRGQELKCF